MSDVTKHVALTAILFDSTTQIRAEVNADTVDEYAARMVAGDRFPPADVFEDSGRYYIGDGWHRLLAAQKNGDVTFPCVVHSGGRIAAIKHALGANAKHGLKRTNADKRKSVEVALREFPNLSDRQIAELCGVGAPMVGRERVANCNSVTVDQPPARLGADGKIRKMPVCSDKNESAPKRIEDESDETSDTDTQGDCVLPSRSKYPPIPPRGMSIAGGVIITLKGILKTDPERTTAILSVRDWCNQQLKQENTQ